MDNLCGKLLSFFEIMYGRDEGANNDLSRTGTDGVRVLGMGGNCGEIAWIDSQDWLVKARYCRGGLCIANLCE